MGWGTPSNSGSEVWKGQFSTVVNETYDAETETSESRDWDVSATSLKRDAQNNGAEVIQGHWK